MRSLFVTDEHTAGRSTPGYFWVGFFTTLGSIAAGALVILVCWAWLGFVLYDFLKHLK